MKRRLQLCALNSGKLFSAEPQSKKTLATCIPADYSSPSECGFSDSLLSLVPLCYKREHDSRSVVSLANINKYSDILEEYANKLPIMAINVSRFLYTLEAFNFRNKESANNSNVKQAIEFYIKTDLKYRDAKLQPNRQFSEFLHTLRCDGYREYIFDLAREINLNIDWVVVRHKVFRRYKRLNKTTRIHRTGVIGYLTVIRDGDRWFVKTTLSSIAADPI